MATKRKTGLRAEEQGQKPPVSDLLPEDFSGDDVLIDDLAGEVPQVDDDNARVRAAIHAALSDPVTVKEIEADDTWEPDEVRGYRGAVDVRTDGFLVLKWHGTREWPIGLRLGSAIPREAVRGVSGELMEDEAGLIAWFHVLPGEVNFRDGTRVVLRYQLVDGYVVDVR